MRYVPLFIFYGSLLAAPLCASSQERKPGLYDLTITTTTVSPSASTYPPRTSQVCLTQEMIDKYGAIVPANITRFCQFTDIDKKPGGMTAALVCSGSLEGKGSIEVHWSDGEHTKGVLHFSGSMHPGDKEIKIEWNATTTSVYKGPDCGAITSPGPAAAPSSSSSPAPSQ